MFIHNPVDIKTISSITKESGVRHYCTPEGKIYPSVTTILDSIKKQELENWKKRVGEKEAARIGKQAAGRGKILHNMVEYYLNNNGVPPNPMPINTFLFNKIRPALDRINNIKCLETSLWSDRLEVAGMTDCAADFDLKLSIIDFKSSIDSKREDMILNYFLQTTLYAMMFHERVGILPKQIVIIISCINDGHQVFIRKTEDYIESCINVLNNFNKI